MELLIKIQTISGLVLYVGVIAVFLIAAACILCKVVEKREQTLDANEDAVVRLVTEKATPAVHETLSRKDALRRFENQQLKIELLRSALSEEGGRK